MVAIDMADPDCDASMVAAGKPPGTSVFGAVMSEQASTEQEDATSAHPSTIVGAKDAALS